jgi:hypothetical protein
MDIVMTLSFWLICSLLAMTAALVLVVGGRSLQPPQWNQTVYIAAQEEVARRFGHRCPPSQGELAAANRLIGEAPRSSAGSDAAAEEAMLLSAIAVLTDDTHHARVDTALTALREDLARSALQRQLNLVAHVPSIHIASRLWGIARVVNVCAFASVGLIRLLRMALPRFDRHIGRAVNRVAASGFVLAVLATAVIYAVTPDKRSFELWSTVGDVSTVIAAVAVGAATGRLYWAFAVVQYGRPRHWSVKGFSIGVALTLFVLAMVALDLSGRFGIWLDRLSRFEASIRIDGQVSAWLGSGLMLACTVLFLKRAYDWIRVANMRASDRLWIAVLMWILAGVGAEVVVLGTGIGPTATAWVLRVCGWGGLALAALACALWCLEWSLRLRALRASGWRVARKGFRWWALIAWVAVAGAASLASPLTSPVGPFAHNATAYQLCGAAVGVLELTAALALYPGAVITALYVRRVGKAYRELEFSAAPPHPGLAAL